MKIRECIKKIKSPLLFALLVSVNPLLAHADSAYTGTIERIVMDDFDHKTSIEYYQFRQRGTKKVFSFPSNWRPPSRISPLAKIKLKGKLNRKKRTIKPRQRIVRRLSKNTPRQIPVQGNKRLIAAIVDFDNASAPCSEAFWRDGFFGGEGSVAEVYNTISSGLVSFQGTVVSGINVPGEHENCDYEFVQQYTEQQLIARGFDPDSYDHIAVLTPPMSCNFIGLSELPGKRVLYQGRCPTRAGTLRTILHEIGHNYGLHHASAIDEDTGASNTFGDFSDFMGGGKTRLNAPHLNYLGWLPEERAVEEEVNTLNPLYPLLPSLINLHSKFPSLVYFPGTIRNTPLYASFRKKSNSEEELSVYFADRIHLHRTYEYDGSGTHLIRTLRDGESFFDPSTNITVNGVDTKRGSFRFSTNRQR